MAKFILTADWQIASSRVDRGVALINSVRKAALQEGATAVFVIGDLLDEKERHSIDCLTGVSEAFRQYAEDGVDLYWIRGNHEVPISSQPHRTIMSVYSDTVNTIIKPQVLRFDDVAVYCLPWYPPTRFKKYCDWAAKETHLDQTKTRLLLAHVGLNEGTFESGVVKQQPVSVTDLHIENYHFVALGDYHTHQKIAPRTYYVGTPISHRFGEENPNRVWLFDTEIKTWNPVKLPDTFPGHFTWEVEKLEDVKNIDVTQINKIRCNIKDVRELRKLYGGPTTIFETYADNDPKHRRRISSQHSDKEILKEFLQQKGWEATHGEYAYSYLKRAQRRVGNVQ